MGSKFQFILPFAITHFSCFGKKSAKRSRHKGHCASRSRAPNPSPCVSPAALTTARSTLTYILSTTKMFRFLPCCGSSSGIRQGGESGAAAVAQLLRGHRHVDETHRGCQVRTGGVHRGGCLSARERDSKRLPYADFFGYFLVRRQESNTQRYIGKGALDCNLNNKISRAAR